MIFYTTKECVKKLLSDIKPQKSAGPDRIANVALKELAHELAPILNALYKQTLKTS